MRESDDFLDLDVENIREMISYANEKDTTTITM